MNLRTKTDQGIASDPQHKGKKGRLRQACIGLKQKLTVPERVGEKCFRLTSVGFFWVQNTHC